MDFQSPNSQPSQQLNPALSFSGSSSISSIGPFDKDDTSELERDFHQSIGESMSDIGKSVSQIEASLDLTANIDVPLEGIQKRRADAVIGPNAFGGSDGSRPLSSDLDRPGPNSVVGFDESYWRRAQMNSSMDDDSSAPAFGGPSARSESAGEQASDSFLARMNAHPRRPELYNAYRDEGKSPARFSENELMAFASNQSSISNMQSLPRTSRPVAADPASIVERTREALQQQFESLERSDPEFDSSQRASAAVFADSPQATAAAFNEGEASTAGSRVAFSYDHLKQLRDETRRRAARDSLDSSEHPNLGSQSSRRTSESFAFGSEREAPARSEHDNLGTETESSVDGVRNETVFYELDAPDAAFRPIVDPDMLFGEGFSEGSSSPRMSAIERDHAQVFSDLMGPDEGPPPSLFASSASIVAAQRGTAGFSSWDGAGATDEAMRRQRAAEAAGRAAIETLGKANSLGISDGLSEVSGLLPPTEFSPHVGAKSSFPTPYAKGAERIPMWSGGGRSAPPPTTPATVIARDTRHGPSRRVLRQVTPMVSEDGDTSSLDANIGSSKHLTGMFASARRPAGPRSPASRVGTRPARVERPASDASLGLGSLLHESRSSLATQRGPASAPPRVFATPASNASRMRGTAEWNSAASSLGYVPFQDPTVDVDKLPKYPQIDIAEPMRGGVLGDVSGSVRAEQVGARRLDSAARVLSGSSDGFAPTVRCDHSHVSEPDAPRQGASESPGLGEIYELLKRTVSRLDVGDKRAGLDEEPARLEQPKSATGAGRQRASPDVPQAVEAGGAPQWHGERPAAPTPSRRRRGVPHANTMPTIAEHDPVMSRFLSDSRAARTPVGSDRAVTPSGRHKPSPRSLDEVVAALSERLAGGARVSPGLVERLSGLSALIGKVVARDSGSCVTAGSTAASNGLGELQQVLLDRLDEYREEVRQLRTEMRPPASQPPTPTRSPRYAARKHDAAVATSPLLRSTSARDPSVRGSVVSGSAARHAAHRATAADLRDVSDDLALSETSTTVAELPPMSAHYSADELSMLEHREMLTALRQKSRKPRISPLYSKEMTRQLADTLSELQRVHVAQFHAPRSPRTCPVCTALDAQTRDPYLFGDRAVAYRSMSTRQLQRMLNAYVSAMEAEFARDKEALSPTRMDAANAYHAFTPIATRTRSRCDKSVRSANVVIELLQEELDALSRRYYKMVAEFRKLDPARSADQRRRRAMAVELKDIVDLLDVKGEQIAVLVELHCVEGENKTKKKGGDDDDERWEGRASWRALESAKALQKALGDIY